MKYNKKSSPSPSVSISPSVSVSFSISPSPSPEPIQTSRDFEVYDIVYSEYRNRHVAIMGVSFNRNGEFLVPVCTKYEQFRENVKDLKLVSTACKTHDEAIATIQAMDKLTPKEEQ